MGILIVIFIIAAIFGLVEEFTKPSNNQESPANPSVLGNLSPILDIMIYYALVEESAWTSVKVQYIRQQLQNELNDEGLKLVHERLKQQHGQSLPTLVAKLKNTLEVNGKTRDVIEIYEGLGVFILELLQLSNASNDKIKAHLTDWWYRLKLNTSKLNQLFDHITKNNQADIQDACKILGLTIDVLSEETVQKAYRSKIKAFHPDMNQSVSAEVLELLEEKTKTLNEAKALLLEHVKTLVQQTFKKCGDCNIRFEHTDKFCTKCGKSLISINVKI